MSAMKWSYVQNIYSVHILCHTSVTWRVCVCVLWRFGLIWLEPSGRRASCSHTCPLLELPWHKMLRSLLVWPQNSNGREKWMLENTSTFVQGNVKQCLKSLTLMLKEIVFLFGDIFGLGISSGSTSLLCFKKTRKTHLVRYVHKTGGRVSFDSLWSSYRWIIASTANIVKHFYCIDTISVSFNKLQLSCTFPLTLMSKAKLDHFNKCFKDRPWNRIKQKMQTKYQSKKKECFLWLQWQNGGDVGFPAPQDTTRVPTYLWHTERSSSSVFSSLDRNSHYNAVHTPVLHQQVEDSAK